MVQAPVLSVVLHAQYAGKNFERSLMSMLDQTLPKKEYEVIVVDDASTDATSRILESFKDDLIVLRMDKRYGDPKCLNIGAAHSKGHLMLFSGVDCVADRRLLENHLRRHSVSDPCAVTGHIGWLDVDEQNTFVKFLEQSSFMFNQGPDYIRDPDNVSYQYLYGANFSIQKQVFSSVGMFNERLIPGWADIELGYRVQSAGIRIIYEKDAVVCHASDLSLSEFSKRMINVGRTAHRLKMLSPCGFPFSDQERDERSVLRLKLETEFCCSMAILFQFGYGHYRFGILRRLLFEAYRRALGNSFQLGYTRQRVRTLTSA
ncbi:MAG TPA: glycosyltransferase [Candidatus Bathyarchaeia archaeon]|nr:glycosyltransferase [Candidatus Bathyarchaeia archaeon]